MRTLQWQQKLLLGDKYLTYKFKYNVQFHLMG